MGEVFLLDPQLVGKQWLMMVNSGLSGGIYIIYNIYIYMYVSGWWFFATPLKNHAVKVSWDDEIPNMER